LNKAILFLLFAVIFTSIFTFPSTAKACLCVPTTSTDTEFTRSAAVFSGTVVSIRENGNEEPFRSVLFDVAETWKGEKQDQIVVSTGFGETDCGFEFEEGREYLVYAHESPTDAGAKPLDDSSTGGMKPLSTTSCSGTGELESSHEKVKLLGASSSSTEPIDSTNGQSNQSLFVYILFTVALSGLAVFLLKKKALK
jgi:hypothetical protein